MTHTSSKSYQLRELTTMASCNDELKKSPSDTIVYKAHGSSADTVLYKAHSVAHMKQCRHSYV
eukprot:1158102-Pelagomonas_calceolata.AAC.3